MKKSTNNSDSDNPSKNPMDIPPLWAHQKQSIGEAMLMDEYALLHEAGTGKTRTLLEILRRKYASHNSIQNTLILCPQVVISNWRDEILRYTKIPDSKIYMLRGSSKRKMKLIGDSVSDSDFSGKGSLDSAISKTHKHPLLSKTNLSAGVIWITNYESMQNDAIVLALLQAGIRVLVCDESQRVKNPRSKRAKSVLKIADSEHCMYRYLMSGTPVTNSPLDLFMQWRILDQGKTFGKNFFSFRGTYLEDLNSRWSGKPNYFPKWVPRSDMMLKLADNISYKSSRVLKSECLDLPPLIKKVISVPFSGEQKRVYDEMAKELVADVKNQLQSGKTHYLVAKMAMEKMLRLQQITSGFIAVPKTALIEGLTDQDQILRALKSREVVYFEENPRAIALKDILTDIVDTEKVIVWSCWEPNYRIIAEVCKDLGVGYRELHGGITGDARDEAIKSFREDPSVRVIIANQAAGGIGINLIEASTAIYYSRNFSLEHDIQSEARNYRGGSEMHKSVTRIDMVASGTVDERVFEALQNKQQVSDLLLDWDVSDLIGENNPWYGVEK